MPSDRICLDTNIVISILSNNAGGHREPHVWEGIREITRDIDRGRSRLVLPTLVFAELLPSHGPPLLPPADVPPPWNPA
jgi:predicted nucleic acid-binding protein